MTWNVWWRFGGRWEARQEGIIGTLGTVRPDVVGLQEVWATDEGTQADLLAERLGMHAAFAEPSLPPPPSPPESPDQQGARVGLGALSRWPITQVERHVLGSGHRPEVVALAVACAHPVGPLHVIVACLDWAPEFATQRAAQARRIVELATDPARDGALPVLVTGDFNAPPDTPEIRILADALTDTWPASRGSDPGHTLSRTNPLAPLEAEHLIDQRIDYVFARPGRREEVIEVRHADLAGTGPWQDGPPSDHYAVVTEIAIGPAGRKRPEGLGANALIT